MNDEVTAPAEESPVVEAPVESTVPAEAQTEAQTEAPKDEELRSRQESIQRAFDAIEKQDESPAEVKQDEQGRLRSPDGKFAKDPESAEEAQAEPDKGQPEKPDSAPARFSADARAEWEKAPASVRGEIGRAIKELESGIQQKDAQLAPLKPYFELASQHGVSLADTMQRYVNMENALREDMRGGLDAIAQNFGMTFDDMVAKATGGKSTSDEKDRQIVSLGQQVQQLTQQMTSLSQGIQDQTTRTIESEIEAFSADKPAFDYLQGDIAAFLQDGTAANLQEAYELALGRAQELMGVLNPPQPKPTPPAQTREALSVTGAPGSGSNPTPRKPSNSRQEAIQRAFSATGL